MAEFESCDKCKFNMTEINKEPCCQCSHGVNLKDFFAPKTNADRIREMTDEELNKFLWWFKIDATASFFEGGGPGAMNAKEQKEWLCSEDSGYINRLMKQGE